ncbi:hypothetical protein JAAARDRAFT_505795 [Jaapia argillacea MUCL 33604]|uniref:Protein kinase domain-containing protein n=1 Tax=Jaapia argillacea MUCL 33604 TaxID=933084 RepID=A0A067P9J9_9AGAM|nr:hypothetical protein JAAARDRAFT_505795 [Jaapia argillacea MUCL 33604]
MLDSPIDQRSRMLPSRVTFSTKVQYSLQRILTLQGRLKKNRIDMLLLANPFAIAHILYLPCDPKWRSYLVIEQQRATLFTDWLHETVMKHVKSALKVTVLGYCAIYGYLSNFGKGSIGHPSNTQYSVRLSEDTSWGIHTLLSSRCRIECDAYVKEGKEAHDEYLRRNLHAWVTDTSGKLPEYNSNNVQRLSTNEQYAIHLLQDRPGFNTPYRDWPHMDQIPSFPDPGLREFTGNLIWLAALLNSPTPYTYLSLLLADSHLWIATLRKVLGILPTQGENRIYKFHSTFQFRRRAIHLLRRLCKSWDKYPEIWDVYVPGDIWLSTNTLDIQRGGYSRVSRGTMRNGRAVALKQLVNNSDLRKNILREAIVWEQADHPHIVKFLGLYSTPDSLYMVSDFIDGMQGKSWAIDKYPSPWQINHVLRQAIDALNYLHNEMGIVHCDMRADNIMVDATDRAHLIDFGLSNIRMDVNSIAHHLATTTQDLTHARWLPPEMFVPDGSGRYVFHDVTTDMWAFGCVIMEAYPGKFKRR